MACCLPTYVAVLWLAITSLNCNCALESFKLSFPSNPHSTYAHLIDTIHSPLHEFTLCYWARLTNISLLGSVFSYCANDQEAMCNQLLAVVTPYPRMYRGNHVSESKVPLPLHKWTHVCTTWSLGSQQFLIYQDGNQVPHFIQQNTQTKGPVPTNGEITIGQDQDTQGGKFDRSQAFNGDISEIHLWDRLLSLKDISDLSKCQQGDLEGNVISWRQAAFTFSGPGVVMRPVTFCFDD